MQSVGPGGRHWPLVQTPLQHWSWPLHLKFSGEQKGTHLPWWQLPQHRLAALAQGVPSAAHPLGRQTWPSHTPPQQPALLSQ